MCATAPPQTGSFRRILIVTPSFGMEGVPPLTRAPVSIGQRSSECSTLSASTPVDLPLAVRRPIRPEDPGPREFECPSWKPSISCIVRFFPDPSPHPLKATLCTSMRCWCGPETRIRRQRRRGCVKNLELESAPRLWPTRKVGTAFGFRELWLLLLGSWQKQLLAPGLLPGPLLTTHQEMFLMRRATLARGLLPGPLLMPHPEMNPMRPTTLARTSRPRARLASTQPRLPLTRLHYLLTGLLPAFGIESA